MSKYGYDHAVLAELDRVIRAAIPQLDFIRQGTLQEDYGGIDVYYTINADCPLQLRVRYNRPANAADEDITLRETEPPMIQRRSYAPLLLVVWLEQGNATFGKLIDVYRMSAFAMPRLWDRPIARTPNGNFLAVPIHELVHRRSLLRLGDQFAWAQACHDGNKRTQEIMRDWNGNGRSKSGDLNG
jgi:hypothetical protein